MTPSQQIDNYISTLPGWQAENISLFRRLLHEVKPDIKEEWKWEVPVWTGKKMICAASGFKAHTKFNFFQGAKLQDPGKVLNAGFDSKQHRSVDLHEGEKVDETKLKQLIQEAIELDSK